MGGGSWKVAYADFVTAMMAFFLLMWILNMAPKEKLVGIASEFHTDATKASNTFINLDDPNNKEAAKLVNLDARTQNRKVDQVDYAIVQALQPLMEKELHLAPTSGISADSKGVMLNITSNLLFKPGTVQFTDEGEKTLGEVMKVLGKYKVYLVVRGHADSTESTGPYPSLWELSAGRANAAVSWLIAHGIDPARLRSVAYADTKPRVPSTVANAAALNGRVEFNFHRPEVMSTMNNY